MIYLEQELCLWCTGNTPQTHYCRSSLMQSVQHCEHPAARSQKYICGQKTPCFFVLLSVEEQEALLAGAFPSFPLWHPQLPEWPRWVFAGRIWCFPESARAAAPQAVTQGECGKGWELCSINFLCHSKAWNTPGKGGCDQPGVRAFHLTPVLYQLFSFSGVAHYPRSLAVQLF